MNATDWFVIFAGAAAVAWVNWYFFLARPSMAVAAGQSVTIVVRGGYSPSVIQGKAGRPIRLSFDRQETSGCSEELVFPAFGLKRFLPAHETTVVEVTPEKAGTYEFTCGMGMLRGRLEVE